MAGEWKKAMTAAKKKFPKDDVEALKEAKRQYGKLRRKAKPAAPAATTKKAITKKAAPPAKKTTTKKTS
jgi:hypothetical protein